MVAVGSTKFADFVLPFLDLLGQFNPADQDCRSSEALQAEHRTEPLFDSPMVLFDGVIQVIVASDRHSLQQFAGSLSDRLTRDAMPHKHQRDLRWHPLSLYLLVQKSLGCVS